MRRGDFERLFTEHSDALFGFLVYRTGDRALTEDVMADAFERALRARRGFDRDRGSEKAWLYAIALNCLRDQARRDATEHRALERVGADARDPGRGLGDAEDRDEVARLLAILTPEEREAVALRYGGDLTVPEIATTLGVPLTTAETRLYRALRRMRDAAAS